MKDYRIRKETTRGGAEYFTIIKELEGSETLCFISDEYISLKDAQRRIDKLRDEQIVKIEIIEY